MIKIAIIEKALWVNKECLPNLKNKTKANKHPGLIVSKLIHLNLLLNPFEMGAGGLPWRDLSVKSNSFCAVNVKVRSACAQLSSQVSSSQPANIQAAAITQHQKKETHTCSHFGSWINYLRSIL